MEWCYIIDVPRGFDTGHLQWLAEAGYSFSCPFERRRSCHGLEVLLIREDWEISHSASPNLTYTVSPPGHAFCCLPWPHAASCLSLALSAFSVRVSLVHHYCKVRHDLHTSRHSLYSLNMGWHSSSVAVPRMNSRIKRVNRPLPDQFL